MVFCPPLRLRMPGSSLGLDKARKSLMFAPRPPVPANAKKREEKMSDLKTHLQLDAERFQITEDFLARYNGPGPRYTSYPTAPVWNDTFGPVDLEAVHAGAEAAKTPVSLYMHLPFCESLCLFCACNVIIQKDKHVSIPYFDVLKKEIARVGEAVSCQREVVQFHWGGGTPTYSTPAQLEDLFSYTKERFTFSPDAESGIEVDPRVTSRER